MQTKQRNNNPPSLPLRRIGGPFRERRASHTDVPLIKHALSEASLPRGFRFAATACGLKKTGALDLAILSSDVPASAAAVFTQNLVVAAPVLISKEHLRASKGRMRAVVVNAGNANCATGAAGHAAAVRTVAEAAKRIGCAPRASSAGRCRWTKFFAPCRSSRGFVAPPRARSRNCRWRSAPRTRARKPRRLGSRWPGKEFTSSAAPKAQG